MAGIGQMDAVVLRVLSNFTEAHAAQLAPAVGEICGIQANRGALARSLRRLASLGLCHRYAGTHSAHGGPARVMYAIAEPGRAELSRSLARALRGTSPGISPLLQQYLADPPQGSAIARARDYGIDVARLRQALLQSPQERYAQAVQAMTAFSKFVK